MGAIKFFGISSKKVFPPIPIPIPTHFYGFRRLTLNYTGPCFRVRRSSDGALTDIRFNDYEMDVAALSSFVGSGDGFIDTWYDQLGPKDFSQTNLANQPLIIKAGVLQTIGTKPAALFEKIDDHLDGFLAGGGSPITRGLSGGVSSFCRVHYVRESVKAGGQITLGSGISGTFGLVSESASTNTLLHKSWADPLYKLVVNTVQKFPTNRGDVYTELNGSKIVTELNCGVAPNLAIKLGMYITGGSVKFDGKIGEMIVYSRPVTDPFVVAGDTVFIDNFINDRFNLF